MQAKLRKLKDGTQTEIKFRADETIERAEMEQVEMEYLYDDPSGLCFMNCETYEQMFLNEKVIGDGKKFLLSNARVTIEFCDDSPIGVSFPETVDLKVTDTEPPLKGATASGSGIVACSISDSDISPTTIAKPTVAAAALVCTATATAVPAAGAANETYTITITDTHNGDIASAQLTLAHPTGSPGF